MTILHTSDWHLGHILYDHDRSDEQQDCMRQIVEIVDKRKPDAVVVSGDIFDRSSPSQTAREIFINTLIELRRNNPKMPIVVTAGNHDGKLLLDNDGRIFRLGGITIVGQVWRKKDGDIDFDRHIIAVHNQQGEEAGYIVAVPHIYENSYPRLSDNSQEGNRIQQFFQALLNQVRIRNIHGLPVVLSAHLLLTGSDIAGHEGSEYDGKLVVGSCENVSQSLLGQGYDYLALGHIHRPQNVSNSHPMARYCGTPLPLNFDEEGEHGVTLVSLPAAGGLPVIEAIPLHNLRPLLTLPEHPKTFAAVVAEMLEFDPMTEAYIRLNVLDDQPLPPDYRYILNNLFKEKKALYCTLKHNALKTVQDADSDVAEIEAFTPEQMPTPLQLAQAYYRKRYGSEMSDELVALFGQADAAARRKAEEGANNNPPQQEE